MLISSRPRKSESKSIAPTSRNMPAVESRRSA